tara:strand:+ start:8870 stop:9304 length:435 start_codon:yes stop_codon:yes gene_type:complete
MARNIGDLVREFMSSKEASEIPEDSRRAYEDEFREQYEGTVGLAEERIILELREYFEDDLSQYTGRLTDRQIEDVIPAMMRDYIRDCTDSYVDLRRGGVDKKEAFEESASIFGYIIEALKLGDKSYHLTSIGIGVNRKAREYLE